ncbi:TNPO1 protein, partial [Hemiprocne comata]|nr:TNPO1 protein [Hemiprocne comata]
GILITTIASKGELQNWPELLPKLCSLLDSEDYNTCEGAFGALQKICEDSAEILDSDVLDRPLNIMIPKFLQFFKHSSPKIRYVQVPGLGSWSQQQVAAGCSNTWIQESTDGDQRRTSGWSSFRTLAMGEEFDPPSPSVYIEYGTYGMEYFFDQFWSPVWSASPQSRVSGVTFFTPFCFQSIKCVSEPSSGLVLHTKLQQLIPVLVNGMKYSEIDIILLKGDVEEDEAIPDSEQDIRPRFHRSRTVAQQHEEDGIEDDDDDDDELDDDDTISDWNLS